MKESTGTRVLYSILMVLGYVAACLMLSPQLEKHLKGEGPKQKPVSVPVETPKAAPAAAANTSSRSNGPQKKYGLTINGQRIEVGVEEIV